MQKISQVLIESEKTRKQTSGRLVRNRDVYTGLPLDYCALGALACEKGFLKERGSDDDISFEDIIRLYDVDPNTIVKMPKNKEHEWISEQGTPLYTAIFRLNDTYEWSFKKIGKWIEKLEKKGVIKYAKD